MSLSDYYIPYLTYKHLPIILVFLIYFLKLILNFKFWKIFSYLICLKYWNNYWGNNFVNYVRTFWKKKKSSPFQVHFRPNLITWSFFTLLVITNYVDTLLKQFRGIVCTLDQTIWAFFTSSFICVLCSLICFVRVFDFA